MFSEQKDKRAAGSFSSKTTLRAQFPCPLWSFLRPHGVTIFGTLTEFTRGSFSAIASSLPEHPGAAPMLKVYGATAYRILAPVLRLGSRFWVPEVCTTVSSLPMLGKVSHKFGGQWELLLHACNANF